MKKVALAAAVLMLAGCSSVVTPASPSTTPSVGPSNAPEPSISAEPTSEPTLPTSRNPYEGGAERDWAIDLPAEPTAVVFDRQSGTAVAAIKDERGTMLHAFSVSNSGRTLPTWTYEVPGRESLASMDAASGVIYVSVGPAEAPTDLIALSARSGSEELRWSRAHVLDTEVPLLIGAYDSGAGIAKLSRNSVLAAIMDSEGRVLTDERLFMMRDSTDAIKVGADIINTGLVGPSKEGTSFITYPGLKVVDGDECWALSNGIVCVLGGQVLEYDARGNLLRELDLPAGSAAEVYEVVGMNPDTSASELAEALIRRVVAPTASASSSGDSAESGAGAGSEPNAGTDGEPGAGIGDSAGESGGENRDEPAGAERGEPTEADSDGPDEGGEPTTEEAERVDRAKRIDRVAAILSDGQWLTDFPAQAEPLRRGAPFGVVNGNIENLETGEALADRVLVGSGQSADMFFEWAGSRLYYLRPLG